MAVIALLTYPDFLDEIQQTSLWGKAVRVQDFSEQTPGQPAGLTRLTYYVEVSAEVMDDILTCRFRVGSAIIMVGSEIEKEKIAKYQRWSERGALLIRRHLISLGFTAAPGLIAMNYKHNILAEWPALWSEQGLDAPAPQEIPDAD